MHVHFLPRVWVFVSVILALPSGTDARRKEDLVFDPNCDPKWKSLAVNHTMCIVEDRNTPPEIHYDQATKDKLVQIHNDFRANVDPPAADMGKLYWDDELAMVASKWARACIVGHDSHREVPSLHGVEINQNMGFGFKKFADCIAVWYNQVRFFTYGKGAEGRRSHHFLQVVAARTHRIGCGQARCGRDNFFACNYAKSANQLERPYESSNTSCSACPDHCDESGKLCDCGGKVCENTGRLDLKTCNCDCGWRKKEYQERQLYFGDTCNVLKCPEDKRDGPYCGPDNLYRTCPGYFASYDCVHMCKICPHNCGEKRCYNNGSMDWGTCQCHCKHFFTGDRCETAVCGGKRCLNGGTLDFNTCECTCPGRAWRGEICEIKTCPYGADDMHCGDGRQFPPAMCNSSFVVSNHVCPYMCNICPHECGDKVCHNGGWMNYTNCQCKCFDLWEGDTCQRNKCPPAEEPGCGTGWMTFCMYSYIRTACPYYCGQCRKGCTSSEKTCLNGGTLDTGTCTCQCPSQFIGDTCQLATDGLQNVALGKTAEMSATYHGANASRAVDGNADTNMFSGSCINTMTTMPGAPWWYVDLGAMFNVEAVVLTNRGDREGYMLSNFKIEVFTDNPKRASGANATLCAQYRGAMPAGLTETFVCPTPLRGRFVRISQSRDRLLFCEVQVLARVE